MVSYIPFLTLFVLTLCQPSTTDIPPQVVIPSGMPSGAPVMECEVLQIQRSDNQVFQLPLEETEVNHNQWWSNQEEQISVFFDGARWNIQAMGAILKSEQTASTTPPSATYFLTSSDGIDLNTLETVPTWDLSFECFDGFYEESSFYFSDDDDVVESSLNDDEFESSESSEELDSFDNFESSDNEDIDSSQAQVTIFTQICDCVVKHNACDGTCMDMFSYNDQECIALMADGVCGGDIPTTMPYAQLCGLEYCPMAIAVSDDDLDFSSSVDFSDEVEGTSSSMDIDVNVSVDFSDEIEDTSSSSGDDDFDVSVDEFDSLDAEIVLYMQICDCVVKHNACDGTCLDMFDYEDQECAALMAGEICGGKLPTTISYSELCGTAYCPLADGSSDEFDSSVEESSDEFDSSVAPEFESSDAAIFTTSDEPNDESFESSVDDEFDSSSDEFDSSVAATGFDSSDAGMVTTFESSDESFEFSVEDFSDEIDESFSMDNNDDVDVSGDDFESSDADLPVETFLQICDCVVKHDACDGTCLDMFDYDDQECAAVMADGICGGDIPTTMSYSELCGTAYCPGEAFSTAFPTVMTTPSPTMTTTSSPTTTSTTTTAPSPTTASTTTMPATSTTTPPPTTTTMPTTSTTTPPPTTTTTTAPSTTPTMTTTTVAPTVAASSEPTVSATVSASPTPSNEPAPVLVKTKLELSVTRETFEAEKENYVEAFAASAGVDKSSVTMYLADDDAEQSAARRVLEKRDLLEALQVICDILTSAPEIVEEVVVSTDFLTEFNKELDQNILQQVFYTETITQAPTPQPPSDSANAVESGSTGSNMSMVLIAVALVVALCAVGVVYGVRGCVSPKVVVVKGSSLTNVQPRRSSLSALYDEVEGDVEHGTTKRGPSASVAATKHEEGSNWPRELYQNITREGDQITTGGDMENVL